MTLRAFQEQFLASVTDAHRSPDAAPGMHVYANNVRGQLTAALRDTYEKTQAWLGDVAFDRDASAYIAQHPSTSWTLDDYGNQFADLLTLTQPGNPEVEELAWLDLRLRRAFSGHDAPAVGVEALHADDWDRIAFRFVPTLSIRRLRTNAPALWAALAEGRRERVTQASPGAGVRVWRKGLTPQFQSISRQEFVFLDLALAGATFSEMCLWLTNDVGEDQVASTAGRLLYEWSTDGLLQGIHESR